MACDWTEDDLKAIKAAYAQGAYRVKYADKEVEYRSLAEMKQIISEMESCLGLKKPKKPMFAVYSNGYDHKCGGCGCG